MAQNVYECMIILDSNRYARDPSGISGQIAQMVEAVEGQVLVSRLWNEQRLAYPIEGHRKGTYWLTYFRMESDRLVEFNRACTINDNVLRSLVLRVEPRMVDALVAHARGEAVAAPQEGDDEPQPVTAGAASEGSDD